MRTKTVLKSFAAMTLIGIASATSAAEVWITEYLAHVYPQGDGSFIITFVNSPPACTSGAVPKYLTVAAGHNGVVADGVKAMRAVSLTALAAGKQIQAAFDDSDSACYINRLRIVN
jgi:hypothetical protein